MKKYYPILICLCWLASLPGHSLAQTTTQEAPIESAFRRNLTDITLQIGDVEYPLSKTTVVPWVDEKTDLVYDPTAYNEIETTSFCRYKKSLICNLIFDTRKTFHIKKLSRPAIDEASLTSFLDDLERQINRDPENARLKFEDNTVSILSEGRTGIKIDKEKSKDILIRYFSWSTGANTLDLPYQKTEPEISTASLSSLGINSLLGEGRSNFKGSPKNRVFNIEVATKRFDGVLIRPGEEFSFVKVLGPVDGEHGYLPELVIKQDKTTPEFGGGICQVSTTTFRAAIYSGLEITARRNHAYPVGYYNPQGMDSTVYVPLPDLRFKNNTPGYILIQPKIVGTELIFQFFGTDDGRKTTVIGPTILEKNPDGSMKTTFTQQVANKDGAIFIDDVFNSNYQSPSKFPHPGEVITQKPADWSKSQWSDYKKANKL
jgi:vancomycin resistance protein YoaR